MHQLAQWRSKALIGYSFEPQTFLKVFNIYREWEVTQSYFFQLCDEKICRGFIPHQHGP